MNAYVWLNGRLRDAAASRRLAPSRVTDGSSPASRGYPSTPPSASYARRGMRVLVIDDDDVVRQTACDILEAAGHQTFQLPSAIGATQLVFREDVHAVVVDVMMPTVSGDKLAQVLRGHAKGKSLFIVLISSASAVNLRRLAQDVAADAVVRKDAIRAELLAAMAQCAAARA